jgi:putative hemolysin
MFPAGRLARRGPDGVLTDPPWASTAISLAQKYEAPIIPVHVAGPNSFWFHAFDRISVELRDITLFHEFLNKAGQRFDLRFGPVVSGSALQIPTAALNDALKAYIERDLAQSPDALPRLSHLS